MSQNNSSLTQAIEEMRNMREVYDQLAEAADAYNTGKTELAANITAKGVEASASETLPELAEKVAAITQETIEIDGGEMYAAQLTGDGALWNLYEVLAQMKSQYMGAGHYAALIVCEYYKGYASLQLQGADAYYTCDGDFYDYDALHTWHDEENNKLNRWVCFLFQQDGARLDITNTSISPRSMYIGGHIGTIEYFVNGRLTALVGGVEETDVVDNFLSHSYTQGWPFNTIIKGVKSTGNSFVYGGSGSLILEDVKTLAYHNDTTNSVTATSASFLQLTNLTAVNRGSANARNTFAIGANLIELRMPNATYLAQGSYYMVNLAVSGQGSLQRIYIPKVTSVSFTITNFIQPTISGGASTFPNLIDITVGALTTSFPCGWNPTTVLANATKKAQLIDNIKNHILARVSDRTGSSRLTFTVSTNMFNAIKDEEITWNGETMTLADAFLTKNWALAGA